MKPRISVELISKEIPTIFIDAIVGVSSVQAEVDGPFFGAIMISSGGYLLTPFEKSDILKAIDQAYEHGHAVLVEEKGEKNA